MIAGSRRFQALERPPTLRMRHPRLKRHRSPTVI